jgi:hypothetical protein
MEDEREKEIEEARVFTWFINMAYVYRNKPKRLHLYYSLCIFQYVVRSYL